MIRDCELPLFTFGWELEATGRSLVSIPDVIVGHDGSVHGDGLEYRTRRQAVFDPERSLSALRVLCMSPGLKVDASCGFHVHVGLGMKTRKLHSWAANFITLARMLEPEAMQAVPDSRRDNSYCRSWKDFKGSVVAPSYSGNKHNNNTRYCWVNPVEIFRPGGIRTIEVRLMGHSKNYLYLLAWTSFCRRMAASSWALVHDPSRLQEEVEDLRAVLVNMRQCFISGEITGTRKAQSVVLLAGRAGFYEALESSMKKLKRREDALRYEMDADAQARDQYNLKIDSIRTYTTREADSLAGTHPDTYLPAGSFIEAIIPDNDGYTVPGRRYPVIQDRPTENRVSIRRNGEGSWWVDRDTVRLYAEAPIAVEV